MATTIAAQLAQRDAQAKEMNVLPTSAAVHEVQIEALVYSQRQKQLERAHL